MTIEEMIRDIDSIDEDLVCFARIPFAISSEVVLTQQDSIKFGHPQYEYFLEILTIKEIVKLMKANVGFCDTNKTFNAILHYSIHDSYPGWMLI